MLVQAVVGQGRMGRREQPTLTTGPLVLRPWTVGDGEVVLAAFANPEISQWHRRRFRSVEHAREWIGQWAGRWVAEQAASWAVADVATGVVLGQVGLRKVDLGNGCAQLSYWVLPEGRGRGVATSAAGKVAEWGFGELGLHRLEIEHSVANAGSCRVAERLGYPLEGTKRSAWLHADGWHDMHLHARVG